LPDLDVQTADSFIRTVAEFTAMSKASKYKYEFDSHGIFQSIVIQDVDSRRFLAELGRRLSCRK